MAKKIRIQIFLDIHDENHQEVPGNYELANRAFSQFTELQPFPRILDVGCGPGRQTVDLYLLTEGTIMVVDLHQQYINALKQKMQDLESNLTDLQAAGYKIVRHFLLPESTWWDYYHPIEKRITRLKGKYMNKNEDLRVLRWNFGK